LEREGYFVVRSAGSFAMDLLAVKDGECFVYEVKSTKSDVFYFDKRCKEQLRKLQELKRFGIAPMFAVYFKRKGWRIVSPNENIIKLDFI